MVRHWLEARESGWRLAAQHQRLRRRPDRRGAWSSSPRRSSPVGATWCVVLIPVLVALMLFINRHYAASPASWRSAPDLVVQTSQPRRARDHARSRGSTGRSCRPINVGALDRDDVMAVHITDDPEDAAGCGASSSSRSPAFRLVLVESPYRPLVGPFVAYLDVLDRAWPPDKPDAITFIVIPEYVARHWWERILHNQSVAPASAGADRPAAHGGHLRAVPARDRAGRAPASPGAARTTGPAAD